MKYECIFWEFTDRFKYLPISTEHRTRVALVSIVSCTIVDKETSLEIVDAWT